MGIIAQNHLHVVIYYNYFEMRLLKHHQIKQEQLKLLQTNGHSLAEYAEATQEIKILSSTQKKINLKDINNSSIKWVRNVGNESNSSLKVFVHVLLHNVYSIRVDQSLLTLIKSAFYNPSLDLTAIKSHPLAELTNNQMKKLVVQFFYLLAFSFFDDKIEAKLTKYPIVMNILVIFMRKILSDLSYECANDYKIELPAQKIYPILSSFFKINLRTEGQYFIFSQPSILVGQNSSLEYQFGTYTGNNQKANPTIKIKQPSYKFQKMVQPLSKSQQNLNRPSKRSNNGLFPKKPMRPYKQMVRKESTQTDESFKIFNDEEIKKTKSLKDYPKRKYSNTDKAQIMPILSLCDLTQKSKKQCICKLQKQTKMSLNSNLYELNITFVYKAGISNSSMIAKKGDVYTNSKGFACELYEVRKSENHFMKRYFQQKKKLQTESSFSHVAGAPSTTYSSKKNAEASNRPTSQFSQHQSSLHQVMPRKFTYFPAKAESQQVIKAPSFPFANKMAVFKHRNSTSNFTLHKKIP